MAARRSSPCKLLLIVLHSKSGTQAGRLCFYEADVVETRGEYCFLFIFLHFNRVIRQQLTLWLWCLVVAVRGTSAAMIKGQSQLLFERAT